MSTENKATIVFFGSPLCHDCRDAKANFDRYGIRYEYRNVQENLANLKDFLRYRDSYPEVFDRLKSIGDIGIPCLVLGDRVFTDWEGYLHELGYSDFVYGTGQACSLDGKGC